LQQTDLILPESYAGIGMIAGIDNKLDVKNNFSYVAILENEMGMRGQLLYQTDTTGSIKYWAVSHSIQQ
jgi:hypothetical protein